jgi:glyoxylase-like metal-dependent hydrolase (beta-lactamase superfamily II)
MRLRTFFAGTGDCLLLTSTEGSHVLIDGGPSRNNFEQRVAPTLNWIHSQGGKLDLVVVTHIDDHHIDGILYLLKLQDRRNPIPSIRALWHNSWPASATAGRRDSPGAWFRSACSLGLLNQSASKERV